MAANLTARQDFSPSCPSGGTWWACGYGTYFVGCCARDPCNITCAQGNLYPGAFDPKAYGQFPDATCGTGSKFYTCTAGKTFWGCCKTNPCAQSGCPDGDLEPAILNRDDLLSAYHATGGSTTVGPASTSPALSASASASTSASPPPQKSDNGTPVAAIAGGAAGGVLAAAAAVGGVVWWLYLRRRKKAKRDAAYAKSSADILPISSMGDNHQQHHPHNKSPESPPSYTSPNPNFTHTFYGPQAQTDPYTHPSYAQNPLNPGDAYLSAVPPNAHDASTSSVHSVAAHNYRAPQELPLSSPSPPKTPAQFRNHKSMYSHARGPSELSGDEPRNELDSAELVSPDLNASSPGRKWSWDDHKEKLQHHHPHDAMAHSPPRRPDARWEEQHLPGDDADPRQRLLVALRRDREQQQLQHGEERSEEDGEEQEEDARSSVHEGGRARAPQGLGLLHVLDSGAEAAASSGDGPDQRVDTTATAKR